MSFVDDVKQTIDSREQEMLKDASFRELQKFYQEMIKLGIATKKSYELPQMDTVGKTVTQSTSSLFKPLNNL
jgi:hypothetical protein